MTAENVPLTPEETQMLAALDEMPKRVLDVVRVKLAGIGRQSKSGQHIRAALNALERDIARDGFDEVEAFHSRGIALVRREP